MTRFKNNLFLIVDRTVLKSNLNKVFSVLKIRTFKLCFIFEIGNFHACQSFHTENTRLKHEILFSFLSASE